MFHIIRITDIGRLVIEEHPEPHKKYIVLRDGNFFTATPCYGMHTPWWIVTTMTGEDKPVEFKNFDKWWPLEEFSKILPAI